MVDSMEYDRLRQRQLRDYQPELSKLGQIQDRINTILHDRKIPDHQKLEMMAEPQAQFERLRAELGILSGEPRAASVPDKVVAPAAPVVPDAAPGPAPPAPEAVQAAVRPQTPAQKPHENTIIDELHLPITMIPKAERLLERFSRNADVISKNAEGELVLNGEAIPKSNFVELVGSLFKKNKNAGLEMTGMKDLFAGMRHLNISPRSFSSSQMKALYNPQPVHPRRHEHEMGTSTSTMTTPMPGTRFPLPLISRGS